MLTVQQYKCSTILIHTKRLKETTTELLKYPKLSSNATNGHLQVFLTTGKILIKKPYM
jgi:hypothetical protein